MGKVNNSMDCLWWLSSLLALAIGVSLGLLGGGGSILTVPVLVYVVGQRPEAAMSTSLAVVGLNAVVGSLLRLRQGGVQWGAAALFGGAGILGAYAGSWFTHLLPGVVLLLLFAALMLVIAGLMLRPAHAPANQRVHTVHWQRALMAGLGVGVLTGFLGVGGGFLIVPALVLFGGLGMVEAVATSLPIIALNSAAGLAGHLSHGGLDWSVTVRFVVMGAVGVALGITLARRTSPTRLRQGFAWFVILVALYMLTRTGLQLL